MEKILEKLLNSLIAQREDVSEALLSWNEKNMSNNQLERQLLNVDMRIDNLLMKMPNG